MLPDGFSWRPWIDGQALYLHDRQIALVTNVREGHVRTNTNPNLAGRRYHFHDTEAQACRFVEAWARKWEAKLREAYPPTARNVPPCDPGV